MPSDESSNQAKADATTARPFTTFKFRVRINIDDKELCTASFSECDGLEMTMEPKTYREGGNNVTQYQLIGPISYGQLTLKRGMTKTFDLWNWFNRVTRPDEYNLRTDVIVEILPSRWAGNNTGDDASASVDARFILYNCLPIKLRAPALSANDGAVAIEEMQIAYERLDAEIPGSSSGEASTTAA